MIRHTCQRTECHNPEMGTLERGPFPWRVVFRWLIGHATRWVCLLSVELAANEPPLFSRCSACTLGPVSGNKPKMGRGMDGMTWDLCFGVAWILRNHCHVIHHTHINAVLQSWPLRRCGIQSTQRDGILVQGLVPVHVPCGVVEMGLCCQCCSGHYLWR